MAAILLLAGSPDPSLALRDVIANQPAIPDSVEPGKTTLSGSGGPTDILVKDDFKLDFGSNKVPTGLVC